MTTCHKQTINVEQQMTSKDNNPNVMTPSV